MKSMKLIKTTNLDATCMVISTEKYGEQLSTLENKSSLPVEGTKPYENGIFRK